MLGTVTILLFAGLGGIAANSAPDNQSELMLPPNAKAGECYARVFAPPTYKTIQERILKHEAHETVETIPARFESAQERVLIREASTRIEIVPATYETVTEKVLVKPASKKLVQVPAVFETVTERVLDRPAHTVWKEGTGPIQKVDNSTGEIMCLARISHQGARKRQLFLI